MSTLTKIFGLPTSKRGAPEDLDLFSFFRDDLIFRALDLQKTYQTNTPFPHMVIDDFMPESIAQRILDLFPDQDFVGYEQPDNPHQVNKLGRLQASQFKGVDPWLRDTLHHFNSMAFINFLHHLTGIGGLIPDAYFDGGAFHQILPGGKLDIHADFNVDLERNLRRKINVLVYLNKDWKEEYGGFLELWDEDLKECKHSIAPVFNRAVIFNTSSTSYHGHPHPLTCPAGVTRKSLAFYYYRAEADVFQEGFAHNTLWQDV